MLCCKEFALHGDLQPDGDRLANPQGMPVRLRLALLLRAVALPTASPATRSS